MGNLNRRIRICITLEGSYPFITGGVSAWIQDLILGLPEIDFILYTISPEYGQKLRYTLPDNIIDHRDFVLGKKFKNSIVISAKKKVEIRNRIIEGFTNNPDISSFISDIIKISPEGYSPFSDFINSDEGWNLIVKENTKKNPVYPFSDFFWAWKSSYELLFNIIGQSLPDADVYHAVSTGFAGLAALCGKIRKNRPFLLTEHGLYHKEREMEIRKASFIKGNQRDMWIDMYNDLSKICYMNSDVITSLFELNRQYQIELGANPIKSIVTPNGIDINKFEVHREERKGFHIGLVGRVVPIKDIKTYIKMAKILSDKIPDCHFYCIGPTDEDTLYFEECVNLVKSLKIETIFSFTGRVNVLDYYCFLDVLLLTSIREAQPLVILEGWVAGIPVVATKVGNIPEMLDYDNRFLAASKDFEALADSVEFIYKYPERIYEINRKNKLKVRNFYNKEKLHQIYRDLYRRLGA